jgi:hypothetical protein
VSVDPMGDGVADWVSHHDISHAGAQRRADLAVMPCWRVPPTSSWSECYALALVVAPTAEAALALVCRHPRAIAPGALQSGRVPGRVELAAEPRWTWALPEPKWWQALMRTTRFRPTGGLEHPPSQPGAAVGRAPRASAALASRAPASSIGVSPWRLPGDAGS